MDVCCDCLLLLQQTSMKISPNKRKNYLSFFYLAKWDILYSVYYQLINVIKIVNIFLGNLLFISLIASAFLL